MSYDMACLFVTKKGRTRAGATLAASSLSVRASQGSRQTKSFSHELNTHRGNAAEKLDGSSVLKRDRTDLSAEEAWRIDTLLTRAEEAFCTVKSPLAKRPICHHVERRAETHIFLCLLTHHLLVSIEKKLRDRGLHISSAAIREQPRNHEAWPTLVPAANERVLRIRKASTPEPHHKKLSELLRVL